MGLWQCSENHNEIFNKFEIILNKTTLKYVNNNLQKAISKEEKNNYKFTSSLIEYYQSLKNNLKTHYKYSYYIISSKTKNISSFHTLKKSKEIFINWAKLLIKNLKNNNYFLEDIEIDINNIKSEISNYIKQNKLLNIFIENFNNYYNNINNKTFIKFILSGLPDFLRPIIWKIILEKNAKNKNRPCIKEYLKQTNNLQNLKQIDKDINRTFIIFNEDNSATIEKVDDEKISKLKNVLIAVSNYNSDIGYTQGMNNIIGFLLKITKFDEEKAFDLAVLIMDKIKDYFIKDFPLLKENLKKFNEEFIKKNTKLYKHFKKNEIPDELWISKWIYTLFTINFPFKEVCRIWDALIVFGFDFIIYISLAIVYYSEDDLLKLDDSSDFVNYFIEKMNPNPGIKKYIDNDPNYKDYVIPIYNIISRAKKIKRDKLIEISYTQIFNHNNRLYNNYYNQYKIPQFKTNYSFDNNNTIKNNILSRLNQSDKKSAITFNKNNNIPNNIRKNSDCSDYSFNILHPNNNLLKKYESNDFIINNINNIKKNNEPNNFIINDINNIKKNNEVNDYINNDINYIRKKSESNGFIINDINNINNINNINKTKNIIFNNYIKNNTSRNYLNSNKNLYSWMNNIYLSENKNSSNFVNGRPRRNIKLLIHKKAPHNFPKTLDNTNISRNNHYLSKSPEYFRLTPNYNANQSINSNNLRYSFIQNKNYPNNNIFVPNLPKRGSYNIPVPFKYYFGYQNTVK